MTRDHIEPHRKQQDEKKKGREGGGEMEGRGEKKRENEKEREQRLGVGQTELLRKHTSFSFRKLIFPRCLCYSVGVM